MLDLDFGIALRNLPVLLQGTWLTLELTIVSVFLGTFLGLFLALCRLSHWRVLSWGAAAYVDFFRGTPLLVQILIIHYGIPQLVQGTSWEYVPNPFLSGILAFTLNSGAYVAEIFRAGIQSIDKGQMEAARSLGMSYGQAMRFVILPQAFKRVIPPLGNEFIALLKDSSLVSVIALPELMMQAKNVAGREYKFFEIYIAVAVIYLIMTMTISRWVAYMERRLRVSDRH
ncbi:amino acid ABC transporter membrane protein, PAAT family [Carboxydocella thermautotrophica]|nr:amino acid ABC transporter membrane protein, PAAT family [Carboxydocella thermautotrophica]